MALLQIHLGSIWFSVTWNGDIQVVLGIFLLGDTLDWSVDGQIVLTLKVLTFCYFCLIFPAPFSPIVSSNLPGGPCLQSKYTEENTRFKLSKTNLGMTSLSALMVAA